MKKIILAFAFLAVLFVVNKAPVVYAEETTIGDTGGISSIIPKCLLGRTISTKCDNVNVFIWLAINIGFYLFSFIGALALLMFVYGGFILILSQGNPQKVTQGKNAMVAAVVGLVIAFSAYALVTFLSNSIGLKSEYKLNMETQKYSA